MTELAWYAFSAGGAIFVVGLAACAVWLRPHSTGPRRVLISTVLFYWLASTWGLSHLPMAAISSGFEPFDREDVPEGRTAIVVMGSGSFTTLAWDGTRFSTLDTWAAGRVLEAARVFRLVSPEWVISSGGLIHPDEVQEPSAITMGRALIALGVPEERLVTETRPRNTATEASFVAVRLRELGVEHTVLVTSRFHMRRSVGAFRAQGVPVIPAVARDPEPPRSWSVLWLPSDEGLSMSALAAHEVLGLGYYTLRGWYRF